MRGQHLILHIKMGLLNGHSKLYFPWQDVSLLSQNCSNWVYTLMASAYIWNCCYNKNTRKNPYESFTSSKLNFNKMHIFGMYKIKQNWNLIAKKESLSTMINKVQLTGFTFQKQWLFKKLGVWNLLTLMIIAHFQNQIIIMKIQNLWHRIKSQPKHQRGRANNSLSHPTEKKDPIFL